MIRDLLSSSRTASLVAPRENENERAGPFASVGAVVSNFHLFFATALILVLPNAIFAFALRPLPAAVALSGCAILVALLWRAPRSGALLRAPLDAPAYAGSLALGLLLCLLGGEGHFFYSTSDWLTRDAVLADLVNNGLTVIYRHEDQDYMLRAPLGMYMIPAMIGRVLGLHGAHFSLLAQNTLVVSTIGYFVTQVANVRKLPMLLLFFAFSGMDVVPTLAAELVSLFRGDDLFPITHLEWWIGHFSGVPLQYSSHLTQLFWVPNHMAPGWWFAVLALLYVRREIDFAVLAASFAALLLWSPLAMMGAAVFLAMFALELFPRRIFETRNLIAVAAGLCFLPIALYLTLDAAAVPHRVLLGVKGFLPLYLPFLAIEIPQAAIVALGWRMVEPSDRRLALLAIAMLAVIPAYSIGGANDFAMRASIPPLFILAFVFSRVAVLTPRDNGRFATAIAVIVILSFATPMIELKQALQAGGYKISDCNMLTSWRKIGPSALPTNYWARADKVPSWLMSTEGTAPLTLEDRKCWPDHPLLEEGMK
ncbi:hypothetical protein ACNHKD_01135 [Methylocystis sp. JAN1]|uniref:hypothetical protein n=1 Tax=Methylocystis sp. JAN1 TaxID=3397211 RepID=UPI003FA2A863